MAVGKKTVMVTIRIIIVLMSIALVVTMLMFFAMFSLFCFYSMVVVRKYGMRQYYT